MADDAVEEEHLVTSPAALAAHITVHAAGGSGSSTKPAVHLLSHPDGTVLGSNGEPWPSWLIRYEFCNVSVLFRELSKA